ncbi:MAG: HAD-IC family P-type ATPase, partial [candidate division WOR-3 bacterium]
SRMNITGFVAVPGRGARAIGPEGVPVLIGSAAFMKENGFEVEHLEAFKKLEEQGKTVVFVAMGGRLRGMIGVADPPKEKASEALAALRDRGKSLVMITGDNERVGKAVGAALGLEQVLTQVMPEDKAKEVARLQEAGHKVAMVGDGINDAPALAQAYVGVAIGTGTDVAIESGDVVLVSGDLKDLARAIDLSRYAMRKIRQNLFWAFFYNLIGIPIAAGVLYPFFGFQLNPVLAGAAMALSSISVVLNSLSMRAWRPRTE